MGGDKLMPAAIGIPDDSREGKAMKEARTKLFLERFLPDLKAFPQTRALLERLKADGVTFWAGPGHTPGEINTNHGGRGVYFDDPSGHHFELITQPYGAGL